MKYVLCITIKCNIYYTSLIFVIIYDSYIFLQLNYKITFQNNPFGFSIARVSDGDVIFNTVSTAFNPLLVHLLPLLLPSTLCFLCSLAFPLHLTPRLLISPPTYTYI
jgi:hypothetical protein